MTLRSFSNFFMMLLLIFTLNACSQNLADSFSGNIAMSPSEPSTNENGIPQMVQPAFAQFQDIPIPDGATMNMDRTLILGEKESWIGRLVINSQAQQSNIFDFFKYRTSQFGWQEITSVRSTTSVLSYSKANRIMTIQIQSQAIVGTQVDITMSPKGVSTISEPAANSTFSGNTPQQLRPVETR